MAMAITKSYATKALRHKYYLKTRKLCPFVTLRQKLKKLSLQNGISNWRNRLSGLTFITSFN